jgi:hypothetical protein
MSKKYAICTLNVQAIKMVFYAFRYITLINIVFYLYFRFDKRLILIFKFWLYVQDGVILFQYCLYLCMHWSMPARRRSS